MNLRLHSKTEESVTKEGIGVCPDLYTVGDRETIAVIKHIIGNDDFYFNPNSYEVRGTYLGRNWFDANMMIYLGQKAWSTLK